MTTPPNGQGWNEPGQPGNQPPGYGQGGQNQQPPYGGGQPPYGAGGQPPYGGGGQPPYGNQSGAPSAGDAFTWGWSAFTRNVAPFVLAMVAYGGLLLIVTIAMFFALFGSLAAGDGASAFAMFSGTGVLFFVVVALLTALMQAGLTRASLDVTEGRPISVGTFFQFAEIGKVVVAIVLIGIGSAIGYSLLYLPGLVFGWIAQFVLFFVIGQRQSPIDAFKSSYALVIANVAETVLLFVLVQVAMGIGSALCGVGLLVAAPVAMLATAFMFRRLQGQQVAG